MPFGPTGYIKGGNAYPDDAGELIFGVAADHANRLVILQFGAPVAWIGLSADEAKQMVVELLRVLQEVTHAH